MATLLCSTLLPGSPETGRIGFGSVVISSAKRAYSPNFSLPCRRQSHGGSVATNPADAQFVIFPSADLTPREQLQQDAFRKRDVPTVLEQWLVRMRRFGRITSWTQWACDPVYRTEPLVEDHELAVQLRMHGVDNTEYQSVDFSEVDRILSRRVRSDLLGVNIHFLLTQTLGSSLITRLNGSENNAGGIDPITFRQCQSIKKSLNHLRLQY